MGASGFLVIHDYRRIKYDIWEFIHLAILENNYKE